MLQLSRLMRASPRRAIVGATAAAGAVGLATVAATVVRTRESQQGGKAWMDRRAQGLYHRMEVMLPVARCEGGVSAHDDDNDKDDDDDDDDDDGLAGFFARNSTVIITTGAVIST